MILPLDKSKGYGKVMRPSEAYSSNSCAKVALAV